MGSFRSNYFVFMRTASLFFLLLFPLLPAAIQAGQNPFHLPPGRWYHKEWKIELLIEQGDAKSDLITIFHADGFTLKRLRSTVVMSHIEDYRVKMEQVSEKTVSSTTETEEPKQPDGSPEKKDDQPPPPASNETEVDPRVREWIHELLTHSQILSFNTSKAELKIRAYAGNQAVPEPVLFFRR